MPSASPAPTDAAPSPAPHVLAVDGHSLVHRAFHALANEPRVPSWLAAGVVRMLGTAWREGPFDAVIVAFDSPDNARKALDADYKAQRDDPPAELVAELDDVRAVLSDCGFAVAETAGAEGDDVLAAVADACDAAGWRCSLLSSDRDLLALVSPCVRLLRPRNSMADLQAYDPDRVVTEYGVRPDQYLDFAALRGDPSDGLAGVSGIGPKTAARLVSDYGNISGIYRALCDLPPRLEARLRAGKARLERNLLLMAPLPHVEVDVAGAVTTGLDLERVQTTLAARDHGATAGMFRWAVERPALPPLPPPPDDHADAATTGGVLGQLAPSRPAPVPLAGVQAALF